MASDLVNSALISGGFNLAGGLFGGSSSSTNRKKLFSIQREMDAFAREQARTMPSAMVEGANRAGIHPLVLFGSGGYQPPSNSVGSLGVEQSGNNWGTAFMNMGQDVNRAIMANKSQQEREALQAQELARYEEAQENQRKRDAAQTEHMGLQNDLIRTQIKRLEQQMIPPKPPSVSGDANVVVKPYNHLKQSDQIAGKWVSEAAPVTSADREVQSLTAGPPSPAMTRYRLGGPNLGYYLEVPSGSSFSEGLESLGTIPSMGHTMAHQALRAVDQWWNGDPKSTPKIKLPAGYHWEWKPLTKAWRAERNSK
ncbi:DNA pilot protein [Apis mellifera associated microvirus 54]|nr:DNA pilot protein [Apis mellifera associated microvirus 54]